MGCIMDSAKQWLVTYMIDRKLINVYESSEKIKSGYNTQYLSVNNVVC